MDVFVTKGTRVRVSRLLLNDPPSALAGAQLKFGAKQQEFVGIVRHVRGDHPTQPTTVGFWVEPEENAEALGAVKCEKCGAMEIGPVDSKHLHMP